MKKWLKPAVLIASLLMIGAGASWIYAPAGLIAVGALLWFDLTLGAIWHAYRQSR